MRITWLFRNKPTQDFNSIPAFSPKSSRNLALAHVNIKTFLNLIDLKLSQILNRRLPYPNLTKNECLVERSLGDDRSIVVKKRTKVILYSRRVISTELFPLIKGILVIQLKRGTKSFKDLKGKSRFQTKDLHIFCKTVRTPPI